MTTIPRAKFAPVDVSMKDEREKLACEVTKTLGYDGLQHAVSSKLRQTLRELDMAPLVKSSVDDYKRRKARNGMWSSDKAALMYFALTVFLWFVLVPVLNYHLDWADISVRGVGVIAMCMLGVVILIVGSMNLDHSGTRISRSWRRIPLAGYAGAVPEFVLEKALSIKRQLPSVELSIDQLFEEEERKERRSRDPFLVASLNGDVQYIDVWDEKQYESTL